MIFLVQDNGMEKKNLDFYLFVHNFVCTHFYNDYHYDPQLKMDKYMRD